MVKHRGWHQLQLEKNEPSTLVTQLSTLLNVQLVTTDSLKVRWGYLAIGLWDEGKREFCCLEHHLHRLSVVLRVKQNTSRVMHS